MDRFGDTQTVELVPGGSSLPVTEANVGRYVLLMSNFLLSRAIASQCSYFLRGFNELIPASWIRMFNQVH